MRIRIFCVSPVAVGKTSPVKVCKRTGTRHIHAASMEMRPAFGVMECTMCGRSRRNARIMSHSDRRSLAKEMWRSMGTSRTATPSLSAISCRASPGEEMTQRS